MLNELDKIVTAYAIGKYLNQPGGVKSLGNNRKGSEWKTTKSTGEELDVMWFKSLNHAELFSTKRERKMVIDTALSNSSGKIRVVLERSDEFADFFEKSLLFRATPARLASSFGWDHTLDWASSEVKTLEDSMETTHIPSLMHPKRGLRSVTSALEISSIGQPHFPLANFLSIERLNGEYGSETPIGIPEE
ncbi:uncharacterized protein RCO7_03084 [Rhynchosporium graminicola]|uniref:Uncharacterized protein n=1 Tax=Rhynchosporium graminicola TaxID=2792576 RepID=A0A1E1KRS4_9HELO|nr:uncharacterized protein RCO7_03084 [Rhynchosporium commune]